MIQNILKQLLLIGFIVLVLGLSIRGIVGNPTENTINFGYWKDEGPLELSPDRGRFALLMSVVENGSFHFSVPLARFATPDLGYKNGNYVSLFAPGVSFLAAPGYILGKGYNVAQVGAFAVISLFALLNALLIRSISKNLGASTSASILAAFAFLFATPAYTYAVSFYQHHISTFLILTCLWLLMRYKQWFILPFIWFLCAASIPIDYPNLFLMFPIGVYALGRMFVFKDKQYTYELRFKFAQLFTAVTVIMPLGFFMWFNLVSYNNPFQFSGTVTTVKAIDDFGQPTAPSVGLSPDQDASATAQTEPGQKSSIQFFNPRRLLNGFYVHLISTDRGILIFTPVILFGLVGMWIVYKKHPNHAALILAIIGINILLYSMWGDPWGGWAFGSRYLIPSYALLAICLGVALTNFKRQPLFILFFFPILCYSIAVNTLGAITSNKNPPFIEIAGLAAQTGQREEHTYVRNLVILQNNSSKSFVYQTVFRDEMTAWQYYQIVTGIIILVSTGTLIKLVRFEKEHI